MRAPDEKLLDEDFDRQIIKTWSPKGSVSNVHRKVDVQAKPRPYLVFGRDVIAVPDIWTALNPSGEASQDCDLEVKVVYQDQNVPSVTYSGARRADRRLEITRDGEALWKVELLPNEEIKEIVVSSRPYLSKTTLHLDKPRYRCGETAHVKRGEKANLLPWPPLSVRNESEFSVDYEITLANAGNSQPRFVAAMKGVKPGTTADFALSSAAALRNLQATNVIVRLACTAPGASDGYLNIALLRGGSAVAKSVKLEYTPVKWVPEVDRLSVVFEASELLFMNNSGAKDAYPAPRKYLEGCQKQVFEDPRFQTILDHYVRCKNKNCANCSDFRKKVEARAKKIADAPADIVGAWNKCVPVEQVPKARGHGADVVAVLLALCEEYYQEELGGDPSDKTDYENIEKRLLGEWPSN